MDVTDEMIQKLAVLSRLQFSEEELPQIRSDLQKMISFVEKLKELDLGGVEPLTHVSEIKNAWREDIAEQPLDRELALKNAAAHDHEFFKSPKVFNKEKNQL